jgi:hypothetical protein
MNTEAEEMEKKMEEKMETIRTNRKKCIDSIGRYSVVKKREFMDEAGVMCCDDLCIYQYNCMEERDILDVDPRRSSCREGEYFEGWTEDDNPEIKSYFQNNPCCSWARLDYM